MSGSEHSQQPAIEDLLAGVAQFMSDNKIFAILLSDGAHVNGKPSEEENWLQLGISEFTQHIIEPLFFICQTHQQHILSNPKSKPLFPPICLS